MKRIVLFLLAALLTACGSATIEGDGTMGNTVNRIIVWQTNHEENKEFFLENSLVQSIAAAVEEAEKYDQSPDLRAPDYTFIVNQGEREELYNVYIDENGGMWLTKEHEAGNVYKLPAAAADRLLLVFPPLQAVSIDTSFITKKDVQLTKFTIQADAGTIQYKIVYRLSERLAAQLQKQKYYFQLEYPDKIQNIFGTHRSEFVEGEPAEEAKEYEILFSASAGQLSSSQLQSIEKYYKEYNLVILDGEQKEIGKLFDIIEIVKEYGAKMELER